MPTVIEETVMSVGKRGRDDRQTLEIPGVWVRPNHRSEVGIVFVNGFLGNVHDYIDNFVAQVGERWPVYATELRRKGVATGQSMAEDLEQIDGTVRDVLETDKLVYFGHSMGLPLAVASQAQHGKPVTAYLGMATYPSYADCFNPNPVGRTHVLSNLVQVLTREFPIGPFSVNLADHDVDVPIHFVIGEGDEVTYTRFQSVRERFQHKFERFAQGSSVVIPGNHCFNTKAYDFAPYNKDNPDRLITEATTFVERIS